MEHMVEETYYSERNLQESALHTGIEEDTNDGTCTEASDEDTNTATFHGTSFNERDIRVLAKDGIARYTLSGSTKVEWEPEDDTQTEQSEYGKTNGNTTPSSGSTKVEWEPKDDTQTEQSEYGVTNGNTTPSSEKTDGKLDEYSQTFVKEKTTETDQSASISTSRPTNELTTSDSGSTDGKWEANEETLVKKNSAGTIERENGTTNDITTPNSDCAEKNLSNVFTSVKDKASEYRWCFNARIDLLTNSLSDKDTDKNKEIKKQKGTIWTQKGNSILIRQCLIWSLLCSMPVAALPRPPGANLFPSEYVNKEDQNDKNNYEGLECLPQISAKTLPEDDFQLIACETSICTYISKIVFEKTGVHSPTEWTPVYEVYNKSNYQALDTNSEYKLKNRAIFNAFQTQYLLYIQPLMLDDRGKWRCVVYDTSNISYTSMTPLEIDSIYVTPANGNFNIQRQQTELVTGQETDFTCVVDGVFPKPDVIWEVDGIDSFNGISSYTERSDKLWSVKNIAKLRFNKKGVYNVICKIKTDKRNPWIQHKRTIDVQGFDCQPQISAKTLPEDYFQQIECETATCTNISRIVFEKTGVDSPNEWTPVFDVYNTSDYHALDIGAVYTLRNRSHFNAFPNKHLLYIQPLRLDDRGKWRCVVYDTSNLRYTSMTPLDINTIYVTPRDENINILRQQTAITTYQATEFTCVVDGVFPKPEVMWEVNSIKRSSGNTNNRERDDKLWSMENKVNLSFYKKGVNNVTCNIKTDQRNGWIQKKITIDVKEAATILIPNNDKTILLKDNSMVSLECVGSGYRPHIHWEKDGKEILDSDLRYQVKRLCNESTCLGYIKTHNSDPELKYAYTGVYTCVVSLENPYNSTRMSPKFNVIMPELTRSSQEPMHRDVHFGLIIVIIVISVVLTIVAVLLCITMLRQRTQKMPTGSYQEHDTMLKN